MEDKKLFWQQAETMPDGARVASMPEAIAKLQFNEEGLIPVIAFCATHKKVLMMAWMNEESLLQTLREKIMVYYSRRRQQLWKKGAVSGCYQRLISLSVDCDGDTLLATVQQEGEGACHTLKSHCFYMRLDENGMIIREDKA